MGPLTGTEHNAETSLIHPARLGSVLPVRVRADGRNGGPRDRLAPEPAERVIPPPRRNTREVAGPTASSEQGRGQTAGCG